MDILELSKLIKHLACEHDCISFAGRGSFLTQVMPASISEHGTVINPPYKRLYYRSNAVCGDTLLADAFASDSGITREEAVEELDRFVSEFCGELDRTKTIVLPGLGKMRATALNDYFFISEPDLDIYPDGRGLVPVNMKVLHQEEPEAEPAAKPEPQSVPEPEAAPELGAVPEPEEVPEPEAVLEPEVEPETEATPEPEAQPDEEPQLEPLVAEPLKETGLSEEESAEEPAAKLEEPALALSEVDVDKEEYHHLTKLEVTLIILAGVALLLLAVYIVFYVCRDQEWVNRLLYSPEERELLRYL
jgi:hypothetical protein